MERICDGVSPIGVLLMRSLIMFQRGRERNEIGQNVRSRYLTGVNFGRD